jgi:hypothetical protein
MHYSDDDMREWEFEVVHNSRPPLRWIANLFGSIGGWAILKVSYLDEKENFGFRYTVYGSLYSTFMPTYYKYGTVYKMKFEEDYLD